MKDAVVIVNPHSGKEGQSELVNAISTHLRQFFDKVVPYVSKDAKDVSDIARAAREEGSTAVFVVGGDGTVSRAVRGLLDGAQDDEDLPILGILPGGTGNGFARVLGIPSAIPEALGEFNPTRKRRIDIIFANGTPYIYTLTGGSLPEGIREVPSKDKTRLGFLAYVASELQRIGDNEQHRLRISVDGRSREEKVNSFVAFSSNALVNLFTDQADAAIDDGLIHLLVLKDASLPALLSLAPDVLRTSIEDNDHTLYMHGTSMRIECLEGNLRCGMDGDDGPCLPVSLNIKPQRVSAFYGSQSTM